MQNTIHRCTTVYKKFWIFKIHEFIMDCECVNRLGFECVFLRRNIQVGNAHSGLWLVDRQAQSEWLKSTSDPHGRSSLPGKSQQYTHKSKAIHTFTVHDKHSKFLYTIVHLWIVLHLWNAFYEYIFLFRARELGFMHVNWDTLVCIVSFAWIIIESNLLS